LFTYLRILPAWREDTRHADLASGQIAEYINNQQAQQCDGFGGMARLLSFVLNGRKRVDAVPDNLLLLDYLREVLRLTGTKTGCDGGECGACTVLVDDAPRLSCLTLAACVEGHRVDTVESLAHDGRLSAV